MRLPKLLRRVLRPVEAAIRRDQEARTKAAVRRTVIRTLAQCFIGDPTATIVSAAIDAVDTVTKKGDEG